jgi:hypothetical protein
MSTNYQRTKDVPLDVIIARLRDLSSAIILGQPAQSGEFTMRIPAECDRDADLVLSEAANRLNAIQARVAELEIENKRLRTANDDCVAWENACNG